MTMTIETAAARLGREIPGAEASIDTALIRVAEAIATTLRARHEGRLPTGTAQAEVLQLVKAQSALMESSTAILRAHKGLLKVGAEHASLPLHPCPDQASLDEDRQLRAVAG